MENSQRSLFLSSEADEWFLRNRDSSKNEVNLELTHISNSLLSFKDEINNVLEIGCADGRKTIQLANCFDAKGYGVDPSSQAIEHAKVNSQSHASFAVATADNLPFAQNYFDLVHFGFCLYLVDRDLLLQAVTEADRVLRRGGFLVITDFDASRPSKTPYHHKEGVMSYRNDYASIFTSSGHYSLISKNSFSHQRDYFDPYPKERVSTQVLVKELEPYQEF